MITIWAEEEKNHPGFSLSPFQGFLDGVWDSEEEVERQAG